MQDTLNHLKHQDLFNDLKNTSLSEWVEVYSAKQIPGTIIREDIYPAIVPISMVKNMLEDTSWEFNKLNRIPSIVTLYENGKGVDIYYPFTTGDRIEQLIINRSFHGVLPDYIEIAEQFRLFHNLFPKTDKNYYILEEDGSSAQAIIMTPNSVCIRRDLLVKYLASKQMALALFFESIRFSDTKFTELASSEIREQITGDSYIYSLYIGPLKSTVLSTSFSMVQGKKIVKPNPFPEEKKKGNFIDFIVASKVDGTFVTCSCSPYTNNFLRVIYFRKDVLLKYYNNSKKYTVEDGLLRCCGLWQIPIDNHHKEYVTAFLGDLGYLPEIEQFHWRSYNIPPHGKSISKITYNRSFNCEFLDSDQPVFLFKRAYEFFNKVYQKTNNWSLFCSLHEDDQQCFKGLNIAIETIESFETQVDHLNKILVEAINVKEIDKTLVSNNPKSKEGSITKLERYLHEIKAIPDYEVHMEFLRELYDLRCALRHRKGKKYKKLKNKYNLNGDTYQEVFINFLNKATELINFLKTYVIHSKVEI